MRKMSYEDLVKFIAEEFKDQQDTNKLKLKQMPWHEAKPENELDWMKAHNIKELFAKRLK